MNLMHSTYKHHVVQLIMENIIIITIEKVTFYSETNNVPYHKKNQLWTIPYTPTMYHTLNTNEIPYHITNDVPYHVPILKPSVNRPHVTVAKPEYQTVGKPNLTTPWQLNNRRSNRPHDTVATNNIEPFHISILNRR